MSDSDASSGLVAEAGATQTADADDGAEWALAGTDAQPLSTLGFDAVSVSEDDWFTDSGPAAMHADDNSDDPLVSLPQTGFAANARGSDIDAFARPEMPATGRISALDVMSSPGEYGTPLDHVEWHFSGLMPLA